VEKFGDKNCLGTRTFEKNGTRGAFKWETYKQVSKRIKNFGAGLVGLFDLPTVRLNSPQFAGNCW
jgi:long-chain acyl-CoA synthetase